MLRCFQRFKIPLFSHFRMQSKSIFTIGLTGGICSGKSHICRDLQQLGVASIDADKLGHLAYAPGSSSVKKLVETFGSDILNGEEIDRKKLGQIVFSDAAEMKKLTDIVWPVISELAQKKIGELEAAGEPVAVVEAAVLIEAQWTSFVDEVWVAQVPRAVAIERLKERNQLTDVEAAKRLDAQLSNEERAQRADVIIDTDRPREETVELVKKIYAERLALRKTK